MSGDSVNFEDHTVEDGELMHSPSDLHPPDHPSGTRTQAEIMDFSLSEDDETSGVRDNDGEEDDEEHMDSLIIKPPQAQIAIGQHSVHQSSNRGNRESRRQERGGHGTTDRYGGSDRGGSRHDKQRVTVSDMANARNKHRDHRERKKQKHYDREKERIYSKQMMYSGEHQQHPGQVNYAMEMASHHHHQSQSNLASSRTKEADRSSSSHHRSSGSSVGSNKHDSLDRSHHSSGSGNKKGGSSSGTRSSTKSTSRGDRDHQGTAAAPQAGEGNGKDEKQQQADRALKDLRDRLLSKRVTGKGDGERSGGSRSSKRGADDAGNAATNVGDALEGEAGQLVKEIIDISTSAVQQHVASSTEPRLSEEAEKEVRRKRLLVAEREMSRQKEQSRQERQERYERMERQRRFQELQQQVERQHISSDDNMEDVVVVTLSSENSLSELDDVDMDSNHADIEIIDNDRRVERIAVVDEDEVELHHHDDNSNESGEHKGVSDISEDDDDDDDEDDEEDEQVAKPRSKSRDKPRDRERKHGSRRHRVKVRDDRGRREKDKGRRRRNSDSDEDEEDSKDAAIEDEPTSGGGSITSRDKERRVHRDSRPHRSHSPILSRSPRSPHTHSPNRSRSPASRSRSRSRSPQRNTNRHALLRSSRSRSRTRSPHKTPPTSNSTHKEAAATDKESSAVSSKKDNNADVIINIDETLPRYYPAIQGCRPVEEFRCLNRIEEGTYGVVYRAQDKRTREIVALKKLKMEKEKEGFPITSLREINTILKGQHPNIVTVREIVVGSHMDKIFIVMDYVEHDLKSLMETMRSRRQAFSAGEVKCLLRQLLLAVAHLHDNWILHRDLKTSNLLLSHRGVLKVGDFGLAREYGSPLKPYTPIVVTLWYRAPELLLCTKEYSTPVDVWSVGCIMGELVLMNALFPGKSEVEQLTKIFKELGTPNETIWPDYPNLPAVKKLHFTTYPVNSLHTRFPQLTTLGCGLLQAFLTYDPKQRVTAEAALHHEYFNEAPLAIDPAMFPTWPAKSELGVNRARASSPKPPSGGREYKQLGADADDPGFGFRIGISMADSRRLAAAAASTGPGSGGIGSGGFSLKF